MLFSRTTAPLIGLAALAALALTGKPAAADTITFSNLTGRFDPLPDLYTEGDFTVTFSPNDWQQTHGAGAPPPTIVSGQDGATIDVKHTGGTLFTFSSVDLADNNLLLTYTLTGLLNGNTVFTSNGDLTSVIFSTTVSPDSTTSIDDLKITFKISSPDTVYVDNITVQSPVAAVPEPSSIASLGLGALGLGGLLLRARKRKVQSA